MKQLNLLKNRGKRRGLPLMSVSRFVMVGIMLFATLQINAEKKKKVMYMIVENNVATFYYDELCNDKFEVGMYVVPIYDGPYGGGLDYSSYIYIHYGDSISNDDLIRIERDTKSNIQRAVFTPSFSNARPTGTSAWFNGMTELREITGLEYLNTSYATTMRWMFRGCSSLTSLDLSSFNTGNVTNMEYMFEGCSSLTSLDVSCFNTSNVTSMYCMFEGCKSLSRLNLSSFNTENVTNMVCMFYGCSSLTSLDLSNFNTGNVTSMSNMFSHCSGLTSLNVNKFNTSNVTSMAGMFSDCSSLTSLDVSCFNTSNVVNMGSYKLSSIDSHIVSNGGMFEGCSSLTSLDLGNFDTSNVTKMEDMFANCSNLTSLDVSKFDTRNVTTMLEMFCRCKSLTNLDLSNFTTNNYTKIDGMLYGISSLESVSIGENMIQMPSFKFCEKIKRIVSYQQEPYVIAADCFTDDVKENAKLYVPNHSRTLYKNTDGWKDFKHIVSKDLDTKVEGDSEFKKDDIDENTDFNGNIFSNIFFNIPTESGEYDSAEGCIILKKTATDEQVKNIFGLDLFNEYLLNNFTGMIFMVDAGSGAIELEAETMGEMMLNVKIGNEEPITKKLNGKSKETIEYDVTEPTLVYIYASMPQAVGAQGVRRANSQDGVLKIYNIKWGKATGISNIYNAADSEVTIYNLKGQHVKVPGKGLYIVNGKKVVVK